MRKTGYSRTDAERELNETGCPEHELKRNGGRVPVCMTNKYGSWLRKHKPIAFSIFYHEKKQKVDRGI